MTKSPSSVFSNVQRLLGRSYPDPEIEYEIEQGRYPYNLVEFRGGYGIKYSDEITFSPEDALAFILNHAKQIANKHTGTTIRDCSIIVS